MRSNYSASREPENPEKSEEVISDTPCLLANYIRITLKLNIMSRLRSSCVEGWQHHEQFATSDSCPLQAIAADIHSARSSSVCCWATQFLVFLYFGLPPLCSVLPYLFLHIFFIMCTTHPKYFVFCSFAVGHRFSFSFFPISTRWCTSVAMILVLLLLHCVYGITACTQCIQIFLIQSFIANYCWHSIVQHSCVDRNLLLTSITFLILVAFLEYCYVHNHIRHTLVMI